MSRILVIDAGNSRMKWGLRGPHGWERLGVAPNGEIGALSLRAWQDLPRPARVYGVNVAGVDDEDSTHAVTGLAFGASELCGRRSSRERRCALMRGAA